MSARNRRIINDDDDDDDDAMMIVRSHVRLPAVRPHCPTLGKLFTDVSCGITSLSLIHI